MSSLTVFKSDSGVEILIDTATGEAFASINGYVRMANSVSRQAIQQRLQGGKVEGVKTAEIETEGGLQEARLIPAKVVYRWLMKDNPELAVEMGEVGATVFMHKLAGYQITSTAVAPQPQTTADMLLMFAQAFKEHEQRLTTIEQENLELKQQLAEQQHLVEAIGMETDANACELERFKNGHGYWFSIAGWCAKNGIKQSVNWMAAQGKKASALCRRKGIQPVKINDPRFGEVGTYPDSILAELNW